MSDLYRVWEPHPFQKLALLSKPCFKSAILHNIIVESNHCQMNNLKRLKKAGLILKGNMKDNTTYFRGWQWNLRRKNVQQTSKTQEIVHTEKSHTNTASFSSPDIPGLYFTIHQCIYTASKGLPNEILFPYSVSYLNKPSHRDE